MPSPMTWWLRASNGFYTSQAYTLGREETEVFEEGVPQPCSKGLAQGPAPPLDPVGVAGQANVKLMYHRASKKKWPCLLRALSLIWQNDLSVIAQYYSKDSTLRNRGPVVRRYVNGRRYRWHMRALEGLDSEDLTSVDVDPAAQLLIRVTDPKEKGSIRFFSGYFHVEKSGDGPVRSRSIFNGKKLSQQFLPAPRVNIPSMTDFIQKVRGLQKRSKTGRLHVVVGDFRHWFHQLEVSERLQEHFGLACKTHSKQADVFRWRCLPMGWAYSPWVAQSCSWLLLAETGLFDTSCLEGIEGRSPESHQLPTFLTSLEGGFGTVYYDNFCLVTEDKEEAALFHKRMPEVCDEFQVSIKEGSLEFFPANGEGFEFLGISFRWATESSPFCWFAGKAKRWASMEISNGQTARQWASWLGKMMFVASLSCLPMCGLQQGPELISALSLVGKGGAQDWEAPVTIPAELYGNILTLWERIIGIGWVHTGECADVSQPAQWDTNYQYVMASDASSKQHGFFLYERDGVTGALRRCTDPLWVNSLTEAGVEFFSHIGMLDSHIYIKEIHSATKALLAFERYCQKKGIEDTPLILATDNSAVAGGFRNGFTNNAKGMEYILQIQHLLPKTRIVLVASDDNPADCPSRGTFEDLAAREARFSTSIALELAGGHVGTPGEPYDPANEGCEKADEGPRHAPPLGHDVATFDELCSILDEN